MVINYRLVQNHKGAVRMNLKELFEIQAGLDAEILKNHPMPDIEELMEKLHTALLVELGEMMNEYRRFKFWSNDREPRTKAECRSCKGKGFITVKWKAEDNQLYQTINDCEECNLTGKCDYLLKELVDGLHFILSLGLKFENMFDEPLRNTDFKVYKTPHLSIEHHFLGLMLTDWSSTPYSLVKGMCQFIGFSEMLGYTWEQVREAYLIKNQENHYRQMNGY
ncbi:dUTPase [Bacillus phage Pony]|uniref:dUTPase n=1 Tax=Bacillus phage Pony TaxID=1406789 RepID=U5PWI5_9CAUD|nr:nucleoside triphosphate pyrophosphohydrolase [Bacillus phage Pony]AGY48289.1 dUTPase [Bacillus phage Pony]